MLYYNYSVDDAFLLGLHSDNAYEHSLICGTCHA